ncbi:hypothetical protein EVAR_21399_1 [Eumeta japonica]|uniref:Uncharacterized protein n=1 Tax=Eumeta variegata TaxID=151549 RepID=A0A4C1VIX8_EUMVA|nr:hypothetical protein EVAR_21399_1 [Eumeta japonica]
MALTEDRSTRTWNAGALPRLGAPNTAATARRTVKRANGGNGRYVRPLATEPNTELSRTPRVNRSEIWTRRTRPSPAAEHARTRTHPRRGRRDVSAGVTADTPSKQNAIFLNDPVMALSLSSARVTSGARRAAAGQSVANRLRNRSCARRAANCYFSRGQKQRCEITIKFGSLGALVPAAVVVYETISMVFAMNEGRSSRSLSRLTHARGAGGGAAAPSPLLEPTAVAGSPLRSGITAKL